MTRNVWIVAIVALLVGGVAGYLVGWNFAPEETVTVTETETVTETVAPPAYTTANGFEARVAFDGASCLYSGPAEVTGGTEATFAYTAAVRGSSLIVWRVLPGTTYEDVADAVSTRAADDPPPFMAEGQLSAPQDAREQQLPMTLTEGNWVVSCATNPDTSTNEVFFATMLRVLPA